jgi:hypothetical protein
MASDLKARVEEWIGTASDIEIEMYLANPAKGFALFAGYNYNLVSGTNEESELLARARHELHRRAKGGELRRWGFATFVAIAALGVAGLNAWATRIERKAPAVIVQPCGPSTGAPADSTTP